MNLIDKMYFCGFEHPYRSKKNSAQYVTVTAACRFNIPHMIFKIRNSTVYNVRYYELRIRNTNELQDNNGLYETVIKDNASNEHIDRLQDVINRINETDRNELWTL